jgi:cytochrome c553
LANPWVERFRLFSEPPHQRRDAAPKQHSNYPEKRTMKKIILLATVIGFTTAITVLAAEVQENWEKTCIKCHGPDGKGNTKMGQKLEIKDYTDAKVQAAFTDDEAFKALKEGLKDSEGKTRMKPAEGLTDDEIKALVQHVRGFKK